MKKIMYISLSFFTLFPLINFANTEIATVPIESVTMAKPNVVFGLDDSGSMDYEVLLRTNDGALWWDENNQGFTDANGAPYFNDSGQTSSFLRYVYLFPNGTTSDARSYSDSSMRAIPPTPAYAFARSPDYNAIYYNPFVTYKPWQAAYLNGQLETFSNAEPLAARSHPVYPSSGSPTTIDLTTNQLSTSSNWVFIMQNKMVIPGGQISGIQYKTSSSGSWQTLSSDLTVPNNSTYIAAIPYYPATYYLKDATCATGPDCFTAPDGQQLKRYEIKPGNTFPSNRSYTDELQNFANWFTYHRKRKLLVSRSLGDVLSQMKGIRGGITQYNNRYTVKIFDFDSSDDANNAKALLGIIYQNPANGTTPARQALNFIGDQYMNNTNLIENACQMNTAMLITDGFANASSVNVPAYNSSLYASEAPYTPLYSSSLADIATAYYTLNLRPDLPTGLVNLAGSNSGSNVDNNKNLHMNTYAFSLGALGYLYNPQNILGLDPFQNPPAWPNPNQDRNPSSIDDLWHATINGRGMMMDASDTDSTIFALNTILSDVLNKSGAGSTAGVASVILKSGDNIGYLTSYRGNTGLLDTYYINTSTGVIDTATPIWSAQTLLNQRTPDSRIIATYNGALGIPFAWDQFTSSMQSQLNLTLPNSTQNGQQVLNWLRGDRQQETTLLRARSSLLGDIVYAEPIIVQKPQNKFIDPAYDTFVNSIANRPKVVYQAANDGMLHAFNADTGQERWAYIPGLVFTKLKSLADPNYTHDFYVDGAPAVNDVYDGTAWKTILVGGLRAGGHGFYALDITDPALITNEQTLADHVLWEFPNANTPQSVVNNIGLSFGKPIIAKTPAAGWVVIVSSGYNNVSGDGYGHVFVLNPNTGAVIADLNTGVGSSLNPSGLAQLSAFAKNPQYNPMIDYVYGGDLLGNVWRFDLSSTSIQNWNVKRIATLVDSQGAPQPITTEPELTEINNKRMIFVGTGKLLGKSDISDTQIQSIYALYDNKSTNPTIEPLRSQLAPRTVSGSTIIGGALDPTVNRGWYLDLPTVGERINVTPVLAFGNLLFNSNAPSPAACSATSYQYLIDPETGLPRNAQVFQDQQTWARKELGNTLVMRPTVLVLENNTAVTINRKVDNTVTNNLVPMQSGNEIKRVAWKELFIE